MQCKNIFLRKNHFFFCFFTVTNSGMTKTSKMFVGTCNNDVGMPQEIILTDF